MIELDDKSGNLLHKAIVATKSNGEKACALIIDLNKKAPDKVQPSLLATNKDGLTPLDFAAELKLSGALKQLIGLCNPADATDAVAKAVQTITPKLNDDERDSMKSFLTSRGFDKVAQTFEHKSYTPHKHAKANFDSKSVEAKSSNPFSNLFKAVRRTKSL